MTPRDDRTVRLLPVPDGDPPYDGPDDDAHRSSRCAPPATQPAASPATQGTLALAFVLPGDLPAVPEPPLPLRVVSDPADDDEPPRLTARCDLPDARAWAARLAQAVVEVVGGDRPIPQLMRWTSEQVYSDLRRATAASARAGAAGRRGASRAAVRSVRVCEPADGVVEACAVVVPRGGTGRTRAVALRLEGLDGRWVCTAVRLG